MIDLDDYKRRLATLAEGLDLADDDGPGSAYVLFVNHLREAFAATPVADLRQAARGLGVIGPARSRDAVICNIAAAWEALPAEGRAYVHPEDQTPGPALRALLAEVRTLVDAARLDSPTGVTRDRLSQALGLLDEGRAWARDLP